MEASFWHDRWDAQKIGFHEGRPNEMMIRHFAALSLAPGSRVFVPLCGKTRDIAWLLAQGHSVVGAELSRIAIEQLFDDLGVTPEITDVGALERFSAPDIDIFVGDIFDLTEEALGPVAAVYDRAALVALPAEMRARYAGHVHAITDGAPQLVICLEYPQSEMDGPPFSIDRAELTRVHGAQYDITALGRTDTEIGPSKQNAAESAWLLR